MFAGQTVGNKMGKDDMWLASFMQYDLRYFDLEQKILLSFDNLFGPSL